ncbi:MAG: hypothetical protein WA771_08015 [Chthoniobacterales bacterium]
MKKTTYLMTLIAGVALALTPMTSQADEEATEKKGKGFSGIVTNFDANAMTMTVENKKGTKTMDYVVNEETKYVDGDNKDSDASAVEVGSRVRVMTENPGDTQVSKLKILPAKGKKGKKDDMEDDEEDIEVNVDRDNTVNDVDE